jgi:hypothetical protein
MIPNQQTINQENNQAIKQSSNQPIIIFIIHFSWLFPLIDFYLFTYQYSSVEILTLF